MPNVFSNFDLHQVIDLRPTVHDFRLLTHHHTSYRGLALVITSAIFLLLADKL